MTRQSWAGAILCLFACVQACRGAPAPSAASIQTKLCLEGAKATIAELARANQWDAVAEKMGTGRADWIALAPKLAAGSDAGSSEDLGISLAFSLPRNAPAVLAAIDPADGIVLGAHRVCGLPFIEDTVKDRPAYRQHAMVAVARVKTPSLQPAKTACLSALQSAR